MTDVVVDRVGSDGRITIWFTPGEDNGAQIDRYSVRDDSEYGESWTCTESPCVLFPLNPYRIKEHYWIVMDARAENSPYTSERVNVAYVDHFSVRPSDEVRAKIAQLVPTDGGLTLTLDVDPTSARAARTYQISTDGGSTWRPLTVDDRLSATVSGLQNGTTYDVSVRVLEQEDGFRIAHVASAVQRVTPATAVPTPLGPPGAPRNVVASLRYGDVTVSWDAPASTGGLPLTRYIVREGGLEFCSTLANSCRIRASDLGQGFDYTSARDVVLTVTADNFTRSYAGSGEGPATTSALHIPGSTLHWSLSQAGVTVSLTGAPNDTPLSGYITDTLNNGNNEVYYECQSIPCTIAMSELDNNRSHDFSLDTSSDLGPQDGTQRFRLYLDSSTLTATGPTVLSNVAVSPAVGGVTVTADAPSDASRVIRYEASRDRGSSWETIPMTGTPLSGFLARSWTSEAFGVSVRAVYGAAATPVTVTAVPDAPTNVVATRGDGSASVAFTSGAEHGTAITGYTVTASPGGRSAPCTASPCTVTGLTNGTAYTFTVTAHSAVGSSGVSTPSPQVTVAAPASAPTVTVESRNGAVQITVAPGADGGLTVDRYEVSLDGGKTWSTLTLTGTPLRATVSTLPDGTPLANGTSYPVLVRAVTAAGPGVASASAPSTPSTVPGAVTNVAAAPSANGDVVVSWSAPSSDGGSRITGYRVTASPGGKTVTCTASPCTVSGLTAGEGYTFSVTAVNSASTRSDAPAPTAVSTPAPAVVQGKPDAPTNVVATASAGAASVAFVTSVEHGAKVTGYTVTASTGQSATCAASPCTVTGLTNGTAVTFTVTASSAAGSSPSSRASAAVTPKAAPAAPAVSATSGDRSVTVRFPAPSDNGSAISGYELSLDGGRTWTALTPTGSPLTATVKGLTNGTSYAVQVRAKNAIGAGSASAVTAVVPATVPGQVSKVTTSVADSGAVTVSWTAPTSTGGSPIVGYRVTASPGGAVCTTTTTSCLVTGLAGPQKYTFTVQADNTVAGRTGTGLGAAVSTTSQVSVPGTPAAPTGVKATPADRSAVVSFTPGATNGAKVTGYTVTAAPGGATATCSASPCTVTGLTNGTAYTFTVVANSAVGSSPASPASASVTPAAVCTASPGIDSWVGTAVKKATTSFAVGGLSTSGSNRLLIATVDFANGSGVVGVTGGGLTWSRVVSSGTTEVWQAWAPSTVKNVTVTAAMKSAATGSISVTAFKGVSLILNTQSTSTGSDGRLRVSVKLDGCSGLTISVKRDGADAATASKP